MPQPPRRPHRSDPQLDLGLTQGSSTLTPPAWSSLPTSTQQILTRLLTRMLVAHTNRASRQDARAGGADEH
ncbi:MAG: hypothetical protein K2X54_14390 [Methylobacterium organophilum]|jgi:hypothetical protein|nr:hypothetical protein [Methylobacterium organophilum]